MTSDQSISSDFPFESRYMDIDGEKIHYVDEGEGQPVVFLHGMPTSNYLWRNIIPNMSKTHRCIAPDLIGMGKSSKPDIEYRIFDHIRFIEKFLDKLNLDNIIFVLHGWGSVIGFDYAMRHQDKIKGLAFYEAHVRPILDWDLLSLPVQQFASLLDDEEASHHAVVDENYMVEKLLPQSILRQLEPEEMAYYRKPFEDPNSRKPMWSYIQDLPLGEGRSDVVDLIGNYSEALKKSNIPKLLLFAIPGFITPVATIKWCHDNLSELSIVDLGEALHFVQETNPQAFSRALNDWSDAL